MTNELVITMITYRMIKDANGMTRNMKITCFIQSANLKQSMDSSLVNYGQCCTKNSKDSLNFLLVP